MVGLELGRRGLSQLEALDDEVATTRKALVV
jgi:hypothetical protein